MFENTLLRQEIESDPAGVGYPQSRTDADIAEIGRLLTEAFGTAPNPEPQRTIPVPLSVPRLLGALSVEGQVFIATQRASDLEPLAARVRAGDGDGIKRWADLYGLSGQLSPSDVAAVYGAVDATQPDPTYTPEIPGPCRLLALFGEGCITLDQIREALI